MNSLHRQAKNAKCYEPEVRHARIIKIVTPNISGLVEVVPAISKLKLSTVPKKAATPVKHPKIKPNPTAISPTKFATKKVITPSPPPIPCKTYAAK